jgi:hypothetical protein
MSAARLAARLLLAAGLWGSTLAPSLVFLAPAAHAAIPWMINYQGRLTDPSGVAVSGSYTFTFRLYDAATGGTKLWEEQQTVSLAEIDNGIFSVVLGASTPLDSVSFNNSIWLSVQVADDTEMSPRQRLTAVGYAMNADQLDGLSSASFVRADADSSSSGKLTLTKSGTALLIKPSADPAASTTLFDVQNAAGTSKFSVDLEGDTAIAGDLAVSGTISGSSALSGTTAATWTTDSDNTSGTEPASGAGFVIEGGSGDASILWDATNDELDINKNVNISGTLAATSITAGGSAVGDVTAVGDITTGAAFTATSGADGTTLYFEGSTGDGNEIALTSADPGSDITVTIPATAGTLITTGDTGTVTAAMIATDAVGSDEIAAGAVDASELAASGVTAATYGSSSAVPTIAVDADGRITSASNTTITVTDAGSGTTSATFTIDSDNTGGSEPAGGAGLKIEGGSGDVNLTWDATNDRLQLDRDMVIDTATYENDSTPRGGLFIAEDPTADDSNGVIFLGRRDNETSGWNILRGKSNGNLFWNGDEIEVEGDSPAYMVFGNSGDPNTKYAWKFNPDVSPKTLSLIERISGVEETLLQFGADGSVGVQDPSGTIRDVISAGGKFKAPTKNLLRNSSFESPDPGGWQDLDVSNSGFQGITSSAGTFKFGTKAVRILDGDGTNVRGIKQVLVNPDQFKGELMTLSVWARTSSGTAIASVGFNDGVTPAANRYQNIGSGGSPLTTTYQNFIYTFQVAATASTLEVILYGAPGGSTDGAQSNGTTDIYFDGITLTRGPLALDFGPSPLTDEGEQTIYGDLTIAADKDPNASGAIGTLAFGKPFGIPPGSFDPSAKTLKWIKDAERFEFNQSMLLSGATGLPPVGTVHKTLLQLGNALDTPDAGGAIIGSNPAGGFAGDFVEFEVGGVQKFRIDESGNVTAAGTISGAGGTGTGTITGVTAGAGLTGGGSSGAVTLTVGAGTGITVNGDDIATTLGVSIAANEMADADHGDVAWSSGVASVEDDSHAHTTTTISGLDISDDTNLAAGTDGIDLNGDTLEFDATEVGTETWGAADGTWTFDATSGTNPTLAWTDSQINLSGNLDLSGSAAIGSTASIDAKYLASIAGANSDTCTFASFAGTNGCAALRVRPDFTHTGAEYVSGLDIRPTFSGDASPTAVSGVTIWPNVDSSTNSMAVSMGLYFPADFTGGTSGNRFIYQNATLASTGVNALGARTRIGGGDPATTEILRVGGTFTTDAANYGTRITPGFDLSTGDFSSTNYGLSVEPSTDADWQLAVVGLTGIQSKLTTTNISATTFAPQLAIGMDVSKSYDASAVPANNYGIRINDMGATNASTAFGLYVVPQTSATTNVGLCFDCDGTWSASTVASGIQFGTDANAVTLYRSASDMLKTDDSLTVAGNIVLSTGGATVDGVDLGTIDTSSSNEINTLTADSGGATSGLAVSLLGGTNGIDTVRASDTVTVNFDPTEVGSVTWGNAGAASYTHTYNVSTGTDPALTFGNDSITTNNALTVNDSLAVQGPQVALYPTGTSTDGVYIGSVASSGTAIRTTADYLDSGGHVLEIGSATPVADGYVGLAMGSQNAVGLGVYMLDNTISTTPYTAVRISEQLGSGGGADTLLDVGYQVALSDDTFTSFFKITDAGQIAYNSTGRPLRTMVLTASGAITASGNATQTLSGTNFKYYTVDFADGSTQDAYWQFVVPDSFDASGGTNVAVTIYWMSSATSGNCRWSIAMDGKPTGTTTTFDSALQTAETANFATNSTANALAAATDSSVASGWADGELAVMKISRVGGDAGDTINTTAKLVAVKIEYYATAESD